MLDMLKTFVANYSVMQIAEMAAAAVAVLVVLVLVLR